MTLDNNEMQLAWAQAQQTTVNTVMAQDTLVRFTFQLDSGNITVNPYDGTNGAGGLQHIY